MGLWKSDATTMAASKERQKCLETLLYIAEIEEYYQTLAAEVDTRALTLTTTPCPTDDDVINENVELAKTYNDCIYAVRSTWDWLSRSSKCMEVHLRNAASYHQFFHEVKHCDTGMSTLTSRLHHDVKTQHYRDIQELVQDVRECTRQLFDFQAKTNQLFERSSDIVPLRLRKEPLEEPIKVVALVDYYQKDISLSQREEVTLLDNSQATKWKVRNEQGQEGLVPAIVLLIPPPDRQVVQEGQRIRLQLLSAWKNCLILLKKRAHQFFQSYLEDHTISDVKCLKTAQRKEVMGCLDDMSALLIPPDEETAEEYKSLYDHVINWKDEIGTMEGVAPDRRSVVPLLESEWEGNQKLLKQLEELGAYVESYEEEVDSTREVQDLLVRDDQGNVKYVSNAYIERVKPVELEDEAASHLTLAEKTPHVTKSGEDETDDGLVEINEEIFEEWQVEKSESVNMEEYCTQTIRETKTFVIVGVVDPRNKEKISIYRAIADGVISQTKGAYCNPDTGETMPIPEAMNRGLILVEFTNSSIEKEAIQKGVITTTTTKEMVQYSVRSVMDPLTGKQIGVAEAIKRGIIDQRKGRYINPQTGDSISIADAIDKGLLSVESSHKKARATRWVPKDYVVKSAYDPRAHRQLSLEEALRRGLIDKTKGVYIDPRSGREIPLDEAMEMSLVNARLADPVKDKNSPFLVRCRTLQNLDEVDFEKGILKSRPMDINYSVFSKIREDLNTEKPCIKDKVTGRMMNVEEAFAEGLLSMNPLHIADAEGRKYNLQEAAALGLIDDETVLEILKAVAPHTLDQLIADGVVDPKTGHYIDPRTGKSMPMSEAIQQGLLDPDRIFFTEPETKSILSLSAGIENKRFNPETGKFIDPTTGREISIQEAIEKNLLDPNVDADMIARQIAALKFLKDNMDTGIKGVHVGPEGTEVSVEEAVTMGALQLSPLHLQDQEGRNYSIQEAAALGLLDSNTAMEILNAIEPNSLEKLIEEGVLDTKTGQFIDPKTGRPITLGEAIRQGLIDPDQVFYTDPATRGILSLGSALDDGKLNAKNGKFRDPDTGREVTLQQAIERGLIDPAVDANMIAEQIAALKLLKDTMDTGKLGIRAGPNGEEISVEDAVMMGALHLSPLHITDGDGRKYSLQEAAALGLIDPTTAKDILKAMDANSLSSLLDKGIINPNTGEYIDPKTGKAMSIADAIRQGLLDPEQVFFTDAETGDIISLADAIEAGKFNPVTGRFKDPVSGRAISIATAMAENAIQPSVNADGIASQIGAVKFLKENVDPTMRGIRNTETGDDLSVEEAVLAGVLDLPRANYRDTANNEIMPIPEGVREDMVKPETAKAIYSAMKDNSLANAIAKGLIDPVTGKFIDPDTKRKMTIQEAIDKGLLDPYSLFFVDPTTGQVTSLGAFIEEGRFNPVTGKFKDPLSGLEIGINNALRKGVIDPSIDPDKLIEDKCSIKDLLADGKKNPKDLIFVTPDGQEMSLKEALANGYLSPDTIVKMDPKTGKVYIADEAGDVVRALIETKKNLDWLSETEATLARQPLASEDIGRLEDQIGEHQNLLDALEDRRPLIESLLKDSQDLIDNNRDLKDGASQQQHQRLKTNTADLKMRFETASNEAADRIKAMNELKDDMEDLHSNLDDLNNWVDGANQEMDDVRRSIAAMDNTDGLLDSFKNFSEEALEREDQLKSVAKDGHRAQDKAKECQKNADKFRHGLAQNIPRPPADPASVIEDEIQKVNDKVTEALNECGTLMTKLNETAAKNKKYNDLKERLSQTLPEMEARMQACSTDVKPGGDPNEQLDEINNLTAEVIAEGKKVQDLKDLGEELVAILDVLGCKDTPKAHEIEETISSYASKYDGLQEDLSDKQHKLNAAIVASQDVSHNLDAMLAWVNETEALFDNFHPISLERNALNDQMQDHRVLVADIESHRAQVDTVAEQCRGSPGAEDKVEQLVDRFDILESRAQQRGAELEDVVQRLAHLHSNVNQIESWLSNSVTALKRESTGETMALKEKIESLYRQKQAKQEDLDLIKALARELIEDANTGNKNHLRETLADVQGKWHELTEMLVQMISFAALREIDDLLKYLDRAENEINTAEPISTDPETLAVQLRDHKAFHEDLEEKKKAVNVTIDKCNKMLRETTNEEADDIKTKLDTIRGQADLVCKLSAERLSHLEEALPLASHFSETHADLESWLSEIEAEIQSLEIPTEANAEQIRKQLDNAKTTQRIIEDHKPLVEDLHNTGQELMDMCTDEDASDVKEDVDHVNAKYDDVKAAIREKLNDIDDALRNATTDVGDTIDGLLEELHYLNNMVEHSDPIAANVDSLKEQIAENSTFVDDLERRLPNIASAKEAVRNLLESQQSPESAEEYEDLRSKLQDLDALQDGILQGTSERSGELERALGVAEAFTKEYQDTIRALRDIQDNLLSQDSPGVDPATVREQQKELQAIQEELAKVMPPLAQCRATASQLESLVGTPGQMELQKHMEDLETALEDIQEGSRDREDELASALDKAERFDNTYQAIMSWLPKAEEKLSAMSPIAAVPRTVRIQIEELKNNPDSIDLDMEVFGVQVKPRYVDIQSLNQFASELKSASPVTAESLTPQVKDVNQRWGVILQAMQDREQNLKDSLVTLGEVDHALDDIIGYLTQTESDLQDLDNVFGDPKYIETHLKKLHYIIKDLKSQQPSVNKLNTAVEDMVKSSGNQAIPFQEKQEEMNELYKSVQITARDKQNQLQDILKEAKAFVGDVEDLIRWMGDFKSNLRTSAPMGALPDTAQKQFDKFMFEFRELEQKEEETQALLLNGEDMLARCQEGEAYQLRRKLEKLKEKVYDTKEKAFRKRRKMEEHLANVRDFHAMLKIHTDWLSNAEKILGSFKHPSKIVDRVLNQIQDHREFRMDIEAHREIMMNLDRTGTYLKYFGRKQDTVYIKNLLISIKLRWKKLVRRADEKGRLLQQAYKEDKRFYDAWKSLCDWLDDSEKKLKKYTSNTPAKVKQDIDELKHFQHQLSSKHPVYYSTMRLGRSLKDRCTKADPEREILQEMLDDLKNRWTIIRSIVAQRQNKLDEALMSSGRFSDALQSLLEWLGKAETYLSEDQPILGDLDTVTILMEQHKAFQQELESRQGMVQTMKSQPTNDPQLLAQIEQLTALWDRVNQLTDIRESRLHEAQKLAEDFNDAVQIVREWLPHAESELKFRALPEDEDAIVVLIEAHEKFQDDLRGHQSNVERIKFLADEILQACHPNAVRFVKYYLTITQTRWEQALTRADQRSQRLQEALRNIRGNAALLEELLAWLTEAQALLAAKEKDPIPEDLTVVDALVKEHLEFHDELGHKNKDCERLTKLPAATRDTRKQLSGSQWKLNEESASPRVSTLQTKWRTVWRMSVDRKKKLQDSLDQLLELESFKNFDFELWRQRYIQWIRAKKLRITDFFRRQDKDGDGVLTRDQFVEGMLASKFPTNRTELNAVFDIFDRDRSGELDYKEFVDALRPERQRGTRSRGGKRPITDGELIHDEIEVQVSHCQCRQQFRVQKVGDGKYKMGEKQKLCLVRFLNNTVMVRVGGGWVTLSEFLENNDPCKALDEGDSKEHPLDSTLGSISSTRSGSKQSRKNDINNRPEWRDVAVTDYKEDFPIRRSYSRSPPRTIVADRPLSTMPVRNSDRAVVSFSRKGSVTRKRPESPEPGQKGRLQRTPSPDVGQKSRQQRAQSPEYGRKGRRENNNDSSERKSRSKSLASERNPVARNATFVKRGRTPSPAKLSKDKPKLELYADIDLPSTAPDNVSRRNQRQKSPVRPGHVSRRNVPQSNSAPPQENFSGQPEGHISRKKVPQNYSAPPKENFPGPPEGHISHRNVPQNYSGPPNEHIQRRSEPQYNSTPPPKNPASPRRAVASPVTSKPPPYPPLNNAQPTQRAPPNSLDALLKNDLIAPQHWDLQNEHTSSQRSTPVSRRYNELSFDSTSTPRSSPSKPQADFNLDLHSPTPYFHNDVFQFSRDEMAVMDPLYPPHGGHPDLYGSALSRDPSLEDTDSLDRRLSELDDADSLEDFPSSNVSVTPRSHMSSSQAEDARPKGRMNIDLRDQLFSPGDPTTRSTPRRKVSTPQSNGAARSDTSSITSSPSASLHKGKLTGSTSSLASSGYSVAGSSNLNSLRKSKLAASWSNLAAASPPMSPLRRHVYGSMTNLHTPAGSSRRSSASTAPHTPTTPTTPKARRKGPTTPGRTPTDSNRSLTSGKNTPNTPSSGRSRSPTSGTGTPSGARNGTSGRANGSSGSAHAAARQAAAAKRLSTPRGPKGRQH